MTFFSYYIQRNQGCGWSTQPPSAQNQLSTDLGRKIESKTLLLVAEHSLLHAVGANSARTAPNTSLKIGQRSYQKQKG